MLAITKGSFKAIMRNPSSVAFSIGFPLVFILVFGFIGSGGPSVAFALANRQDWQQRACGNPAERYLAFGLKLFPWVGVELG